MHPNDPLKEWSTIKVAGTVDIPSPTRRPIAKTNSHSASYLENCLASSSFRRILTSLSTNSEP